MQRQAEFINRFREEEIWRNVIIVAKQPGSFSLEKSCQGAEEAAKMLSGGRGQTVQRLGFTYLDDSIPEDFRQVLNSLGWSGWRYILPEERREERRVCIIVTFVSLRPRQEERYALL